MTDAEYRMVSRELAAARRILSAPDRHTRAELAYAEARAKELAPHVTAYICAQWGEVLAAISRDITQFFADLAEALRPVTSWQVRFGGALRAAEAERLAEARRQRLFRRQGLRAARQRARLSTQVRARKRHGQSLRSMRR